ncbi:S41 family peptidase [Herbivorax sp. ANBcel31]|uniref:S41 family peptidase n=1 Tax=Herbivorax sp. ANBcel31 TaxID=3069754 RepID=UPI0027B448D5|nr:S41 family peptidase [Herbivorax sp. ANBcel31]MDQ2087884.1 S41 family peptidase [Herbivorax sp. ANBcel31]
MKIKKYKLKKPFNTVNMFLVVALIILLLFSRQWAGLVFFAGVFVNCLYYLISSKNNSIKNIGYIVCVVVIAQAAMLNFYSFSKSILYTNGTYVYKSDAEDIVNFLEEKSLNTSFLDKEEYISVKDNMLDKLLIKKSDVEEYLNEAIMLSRENDMLYSYINIEEDVKKEVDECESDSDEESIFEDQGTEIFEYIEISEFDECNFKVFEKRLEEKKNDTLIIDLRGNRGGRRDVLIDSASLLLPEGEEIMTSHERYLRTTYFSKGNNYNFDDIIFLVDGTTASCAEILAFTLKEYDQDRVKIIGNNTKGKGVGQKVNKYYGSGIEVGIVTSTWTVANQDVSALFEHIENDSGEREFKSDNDYFSVVARILSENQ